MPIYGYEIGLGTDLPDGSLTNIEAISVPNTVLALTDIIDRYEVDDNTHYIVSGEPLQENIVQLPNTTVQQGRNRKDWRFLTMSDVAFEYWIDTYRGQRVTIKTTVHKNNSYEKWNAQVGRETIGERHFLQGTWWYKDVTVPMYLTGTVA